MQQENIKNYLFMLGLEQQVQSTSYNPRITQVSYQRGSSFNMRHLSDWDNRKQLSLQFSSSLPKLGRRRRKDSPRDPRIQSMDMTSRRPNLYKNNSESLNKQIGSIASPINIKFQKQSTMGKVAKRSQLYFHKILHDTGHKRQDPAYLRNAISKVHPHKQNQEAIVPITERSALIYKLLQRKQQVRIFKHKLQNHQALVASKIYCI